MQSKANFSRTISTTTRVMPCLEGHSVHHQHKMQKNDHNDFGLISLIGIDRVLLNDQEEMDASYWENRW